MPKFTLKKKHLGPQISNTYSLKFKKCIFLTHLVFSMRLRSFKGIKFKKQILRPQILNYINMGKIFTTIKQKLMI